MTGITPQFAQPIGPEEVQEKTRDVTAQYVDLEARIANQKKLEERIVGVLDEVKGKIGEVLEVEQQLARVRENIERLEGQMRVLKDQVTMATLTIHVREDKDYVPPQEPSFGDSIGEMWSDSIAALKTFCKGQVRTPSRNLQCKMSSRRTHQMSLVYLFKNADQLFLKLLSKFLHRFQRHE